MKLPRITADKAIKVLTKLGFNLVRQSGSHKIYRNDKGIRVTIPYHSGKILHPRLVKTMLQDLDLDLKEFKKLVK